MSVHQSFSTKRLALLALLTAACVVGRLSFAFIPNVQPMTAILLLIAFFCSFKEAFLVSTLSLLITNLYLGMGPWTISQLIAFSGVTLCFFLLGKVPLMKKHLLLQSSAAFFMGILYGFLVSQMEVFFYQLPSFWAYYLQGIPFDLFHSIGNFAFYLVLYPIFIKFFLPAFTLKA